MASSGTVNSSSYGNWYLQLNWTQTAKNSNTNKSTISWNVKTIRSSGSGSYYVGNITAKIGGVTVYSCDNSNRWLMSDGAVVASGSSLQIQHNNDGTKQITCEIKGAIYTYADNVSGSKSFALDTIPRYATISQSLAGRTENSITVSWTADATCDYLWYSSDNGSTFTGVTIAQATSGSYTITGLSVGTSYNVITKVRRKDSQLSSQTSAQAMSTYPKPYANATPDFVLGNVLTVSVFNPLSKGVRVSLLDCNGSVIETANGSLNGNVQFFNPNYYDPAVLQAMIDAMYASIPNATSGTYSIKVENMDDPTDYTTTTGGVYSVDPADCTPEIGSATYADVNPNTTSVIQDDSKLVQNLSTPQFTASNLQGKKSATIASVSVAVMGTSYALTVSGTSATGTGGTINSSANVSAVFTITDSRGLTNTKTITLTMLAWTSPTAIVTVGRVSNFYTTTDMLVDAEYPYLDGKNTITITYLGKAVPITGQTTPSDVSGSLQDNVTGQANFDNNFAWNITFTLTDAFNATATYSAYISRGMPIVFFDRMRRSVGVNMFPSHDETVEIDGDLYADNINGANGVFSGNVSGVDGSFSGDVSGNDFKMGGSSIFPIPIANGGTGATSGADALKNLVSNVFSRFSDSITTTTEGQNSNVRNYTVVGDGLVFVSITCRRDGTSNSYGTWNAEIQYDGTIWAKQLNRFGSAQNLDFAVNACALIPVTNGKVIKTTMGSTFTGTKRFIYNVVAFGCTFTIS